MKATGLERSARQQPPTGKDHTTVLILVLLVFALIAFALATFSLTVPPFNLTAAGLLFLTIAIFIALNPLGATT